MSNLLCALDVFELGLGGVARVIGAGELALLLAIGVALMLLGATLPGFGALCVVDFGDLMSSGVDSKAASASAV